MKPSLSLLYHKLKEEGFFGKPKDRLLLDEALEIISERLVSDSPSLTFVQLPPGYGKTAIPFSLALWAILNDETPIERSIHVLPLRAIVEDVNTRFTGYGQNGEDRLMGLRAFKVPRDDAENVSGAQCMFIHGSPFLQKEGFISTTLDTFTLLACKLPILEISKIARSRGYELYGHYEIARGAILSSVIIFDEAHLFFEEHEGSGKASEALIALMVALLRWRVPIIMMTATLPSSLRKGITEWIKEYVPNVRFSVFEYGHEGKVDRDFEGEIRSVNFRTRFEEDEEEYINLIQQTYSSYDRVLVVANTIRRAVNLFNKLESKGLKPVLLHSKFIQEDRINKLERLKRSSKWLCISTQVIEAGVDISSDVLFTDVAPICSIVQRAGRCCRPSHARLEAGEVTICISKESIEAAKKIYDESKIEATYEGLTKIDKVFHWHSYLDYFPLISRVYSRELDLKLGYTFTSMQNIIEEPYYESTDAFISLLELGGSFTRESLLIPAVVCKKDEVKDLEDLRNRSGSFIPIEGNELKMICKKSEVGALFVKEGGRIEERPVSGKIMENMVAYVINGEIRAFRIPKEVYDEERGLKL
ncbi:MAG: CRISPR-associated helicase Cas3' [Candidatus Methanomethylicaceae archaeon]